MCIGLYICRLSVTKSHKHEKLTQCRANNGTANARGAPALNQQWVKIFSLSWCIRYMSLPSEDETLSQCWFIVGPASTTMAQHWPNTGSMSRACLLGMRRHWCIILWCCTLWSIIRVERPHVTSAAKQDAAITDIQHQSSSISIYKSVVG